MSSPQIKIFPPPTIKLSPRVRSAMHAFTTVDQRSEKGMLLLGTVDGVVVNVTEFAIYPQTGSAYGVDFDSTHKHAAKFWPALNEHCQKHGLVIVGWGHYYHGGVHHSHADQWQDDKLSLHLKEKAPIFVSLTWNDVSVGAEGKMWTKSNNEAIQISIGEIEVSWDQDPTVEMVDNFLAARQDRQAKIDVHFGKNCIAFNPQTLGQKLEDNQIWINAASEWLKKNPEFLTSLLNEKELNDLRTDRAVTVDVHNQLKSMWRYGEPQHFEWRQPKIKNEKRAVEDQKDGKKAIVPAPAPPIIETDPVQERDQREWTVTRIPRRSIVSKLLEKLAEK